MRQAAIEANKWESYHNDFKDELDKAMQQHCCMIVAAKLQTAVSKYSARQSRRPNRTRLSPQRLSLRKSLSESSCVSGSKYAPYSVC